MHAKRRTNKTQRPSRRGAMNKGRRRSDCFWDFNEQEWNWSAYPSQVDYQTSWTMFLARLGSSREEEVRTSMAPPKFGDPNFNRYVRIQNIQDLIWVLGASTTGWANLWGQKRQWCGFYIYVARMHCPEDSKFIILYISACLYRPPFHMPKKKGKESIPKSARRRNVLIKMVRYGRPLSHAPQKGGRVICYDSRRRKGLSQFG